MGSLHQLPVRHRHRHRHQRRAPPSSTCPACGGPVPQDGPERATFCSPECRVRALKEGGDPAVRDRLSRVILTVEMLSTELEGLIDVLAATSSKPTGRRR